MNDHEERHLTTRQQRVLDFIRESTARRGFPPTVREIGAAVGLAAPSSVAHHLDALSRLGLLRRTPRSPRGMDARTHPAPPRVVQVPLLGTIAAGAPILAEEFLEQYLPLPASVIGEGDHFALRVKGQSMIGAAICDGDVVVVRQQPVAETGDIVAAIIDDEATVKTYRVRDGHVELVPHNDAYQIIPGDHARILGKVVCVFRRC